jgi:hypothetical protein
MMDSRQYEKVNNPRILIIDEDDKIPDNIKYFCGKRYDKVFIHRKNKNIAEFKEILKPNITVLGYEFGVIYEYE